MDIGWKIVSTGAGVVAGLAANKLLDIGWRAAVGHRPPSQDDFEEYHVVETIVFAAVSGAVISLTRHLVLQQASKWYGGPGPQAISAKN